MIIKTIIKNNKVIVAQEFNFRKQQKYFYQLLLGALKATKIGAKGTHFQ